jgi:membrane associated rhomboid family serine protease
MSQQSSSPMPWWQIILILLAVGVVVGLLIGAVGLTGIWADAAVGAGIGVVAVLLVNRFRKAS